MYTDVEKDGGPCGSDPSSDPHALNPMPCICIFTCLSLLLYISVSLCVSAMSHLPLASSQGQRWHLGSEPFGRPWQSGDVVGCMIDLTENTIIFTLNGEVLMSDSGSETAFREIEVGDGEDWPHGPFLVFFHLT